MRDTHFARLTLVVVSALLPGLVLAGNVSAASPPDRSRATSPASGAPDAPGPASYAYDAAGRLAGVVKDKSGSARYAYDAAGNLLSAQRLGAGALSVSSVQPLAGRPGATVTVSGSGFATTPDANTVRFGGHDAAVTAATTTRLTVEVPAGATSGPVSVTTAGGTASSTETFTVREALAELAITAFTPVSAATGASVTITGSGFSTTPADNTVAFGATRARVTAASSTSLKVTVPFAAGSGRIRVGVPSGGIATSTADFVALPYGTPADQISSFGVVAVNGDQVAVTLNDGQRSALLRFSGTKGQRLSFGLAGMAKPSTVYATFFTPYGEPFGRDEYDRGRWVDGASGGYELPPLPVSGTYLVKVTPTVDAVGTLTATLSNRVAARLSPDGEGTRLTLTRPGQQAELSVAATKGQSIGLGFTESTFRADTTMLATVREPHGTPLRRDDDGSTAVAVRLDGSGDDSFTASSTGTYTILVGTRDQSTGSVTVFASRPRSAGSVTTGSAKNLTVSRPGQDLALTYAGGINQELSVDLSDVGVDHQPHLTISAPGGQVFWKGHLEGHRDLAPLPASGTYTLMISTASETGSMTLRLRTRQRAGTVSATGPSVAVRIATRGAAGELSFSAREGQLLSFGFTNWGFPKTALLQVEVIDPDGDEVAFYSDIGDLDEFFFTAGDTGTHRVRLTAEDDSSAGSVAVTLSAEKAGGTVGIGTVHDFAVNRPGEVTRYRFSGTKGQRLSLVVNGYTMTRSLFVRVFRPDGGVLIERVSRTGVDLDPLPATGTYQFLVVPAAETGTATLRLAPRSVFDEMDVGGDPANLAVGQLGGAAETSFSVDADERLSIGFTETDFQDTPFRARVLAPDGSVVLDYRIYHGSFLTIVGTRSGVYRLILAPSEAQYGSALVTLSEQIAAGRLSYDSPKTVTIGRPGQSAWMTFNGTAGQQPTVTFTDLTMRYRPYLEVIAPDGAYLMGDNTDANPLAFGKLPKTGRYEIMINPYASPGSVELTLRDDGEANANADPPKDRAGDRTGSPPPPLADRRRPAEPAHHAKPGAEARRLKPGHRAAVVASRPTRDEATGPDGPPPPDATHECAPGGPCSPGGAPPPGTAPVPGGGATGGDPVDLGTGLLHDAQTDLTVRDVLPVTVTRTYQQSDSGLRAFGFGVSLEYDMYLYSHGDAPDLSWLVLPDGSRIRYNRTTPTGSGAAQYRSSVFAAAPTPTRFKGSIMAWNGNGFDVRMADGLTFVFGQQAPLREIRDRYGNTITITRHSGGRNSAGDPLDNGPIAQVTSPNGRWIRFDYDRRSRVTRAEDNSGRAVTYTYTSGGRLSTVADPTGSVSSYTWDSKGRMAAAKDNRGTVYLTNTYDSLGRVAKQTLGDGGTYGFAYVTNPAGKILQTRLTDQRGMVQRYFFDADGFVTSHTAGHGTALARTTTTTWNSDKLPVAVTDPLGRRTEAKYDPAGNVVERTYLAGTSAARIERMAYDGPYGQLSRRVDTLGRTTNVVYAGDGAPRSVTDPMSRVTSFETNTSGRLLEVRDSLGRRSAYTYAFGDVAARTDPLGRMVRQVTDGAGRVVQAVDAQGNTATIAYDAADRPVATTDPLGRVTRSEYDPNGNLVAVTDPNGNATRYGYDAQNRIVSSTDPLGRVARTVYDSAGNATSTTARSGITTATDYDPLGRKTRTRFGVSGDRVASSIDYGYDAAGRLTSIADSESGTIANAYDAFDNLTRTTTPQGRVDYTYDAADQRTGVTVAGQPQTGYTFNAGGQLTGIRRGNDSVTIGYDAAGRRSEVRLPNGTVQTYAYTATDRIASLTYAREGRTIGNLSYRYDANDRPEQVGGSLANVTLPAAYGPATYDAANQLAGVGGTDYHYDADGNLLSDGTTTYTWNARQQLVGTRTGDSTITYSYDGAGRRVEKANGTATTRYLYDGANVAAEFTGGTLTASTITGGTDEVFARIANGTTLSLLTDALGSTVAVADPAGGLAATYGYAPFGATTVTGDDAGNTIRFTGREDEGDGRYFYRARYYSATDQRFLSQDPLGIGSGDTNLYAYVGNQPTGLVDPFGLSAQAVGSGWSMSGESKMATALSIASGIRQAGDWFFDSRNAIAVVGGSIAVVATVVGAIASAPVVVTVAGAVAAVAGGVALVASVVDTVDACLVNSNRSGCGLGIASLALAGKGALFASGLKGLAKQLRSERAARMPERDIGKFERWGKAVDVVPWVGVVVDGIGAWGN